jgi:hypothetical protein
MQEIAEHLRLARNARTLGSGRRVQPLRRDGNARISIRRLLKSVSLSHRRFQSKRILRSPQLR